MSAAPAAAPAVTHLLYLHGFRSSPQSTKATKVGAWIAAHRPDVVWWCPQLAASPAAAMRDVAERHGGRAVVLNPAVDPARDLAKAVGTTTAWHSDAPFEFRSDYVDELRALAPPAELTDPARYLAVIATGDEVLSWREMRARYAACRLRVIDGSDHAISDFDDHLGAVLAFLGLTASRRLKPPSG